MPRPEPEPEQPSARLVSEAEFAAPPPRRPGARERAILVQGIGDLAPRDGDPDDLLEDSSILVRGIRGATDAEDDAEAANVGIVRVIGGANGRDDASPGGG